MNGHDTSALTISYAERMIRGPTRIMKAISGNNTPKTST